MNNQATNFREAVAENLQQVFMGQGQFEESVTWYDSEAAEGRSISVVDVTAVGESPTEAHHRKTARVVHFLVTRDATLGTLQPATGNKIVRADGTAWGFKKVVSEDFAGWVLEFVGGTLDRVGFARADHL